MVSTIQGHKVVTLKMSYFMTNIVLVKRLGKIWMNFAIFFPSGFFYLQLTEYDAESYNFQQIYH